MVFNNDKNMLHRLDVFVLIWSFYNEAKGYENTLCDN